MKNQQLAKKLITLHEANFVLRQKLIDAKTLSDGYHPEMATLHNQNAVALQEIIDQIGFPTVDKVGKPPMQPLQLCSTPLSSHCL
ncbi:MAG: hypothetical protein RLZZ312_1939 [Bacteroidota bacterium]|jgi:hypothetical protein